MGKYSGPEKPAVLTHHFEDFVEVNLIKPIDDTSNPMLWGHRGSNVGAWPRETRQAPPDQVLLIGNTENEAYSQLRKAARTERDAPRSSCYKQTAPASRNKRTSPPAAGPSPGRRSKKSTGTPKPTSKRPGKHWHRPSKEDRRDMTPTLRGRTTPRDPEGPGPSAP